MTKLLYYVVNLGILYDYCFFITIYGFFFLSPYIWVTGFLLPYMGLESSVVKIDL